ncbi:hypothetical protein L195_g015074 [Trifolium pratense]|uniref:Uncharacterized protein n=1 Tax=Trifolium pratense TaxID=57577 RepID=A0A2K3MMA3_TRIPR|nr:hypothetical protein L195_g015074 [Trifolium pratense]
MFSSTGMFASIASIDVNVGHAIDSICYVLFLDEVSRNIDLVYGGGSIAASV